MGIFIGIEMKTSSISKSVFIESSHIWENDMLKIRHPLVVYLVPTDINIYFEFNIRTTDKVLYMIGTCVA